MKNLNRWVYAAVGVVVLLLAGLVYAWSTMSNSIGISRPDWTKAQLSLTFTIVMAMFCVGCLIAGFLAKKVAPKYYVMVAAVLMLAGFYVASLTGDTPALLYIGFGVLGGLGSGFAYNAVMSTISAWFPDKQGLISGVLLMGFGLSAFIVGKIYTAVTPSDGSDAWQTTFFWLGIILFVVLMICSFFFVKPGADFVPPTTAKKKIVREPASDIKTGVISVDVDAVIQHAFKSAVLHTHQTRAVEAMETVCIDGDDAPAALRIGKHAHAGEGDIVT